MGLGSQANLNLNIVPGTYHFTESKMPSIIKHTIILCITENKKNATSKL